MLQNYIIDQNRFKLGGPPRWWLRKLWDFDNSLVVVPSRQDCLYRLAQRRKLNLRENMTNDVLFKQSDTRMLASYGLVPVTSIIATANWGNPYLFEELRRRAPWRMGGADKMNQLLDAQDAQEELDKKAKTDEHLDYLGKDAWNLYLKKIGVRSHMYSPNTGRKPSIPAGAMVKTSKNQQDYSVGSIFLP